MARLGNYVRENWLFLLVVAALLAAFLVLRTRGADIASAEEFRATLANGQVTIVEFYSNF